MEQPLTANIESTVLPSGLQVVTETMPAVRSVSLGVWLTEGSRNEADRDSGMTHFIEHMVFKGTERFSARELACEIDGLGGHLDAFTSKETTAFTAKVLDEHWPRALDVLADMVRNPTLAEDEIEREKGVVIEELKMDQDNPDRLLGTVFAGSFWRGHGMGRPVTGTEESVQGFSRDRLQQFFANTFREQNLLLVAAGNVDHAAFLGEVQLHFGSRAVRQPARARKPPEAHPEIVLHDKPALEQVHMLLGMETFSALDPGRFAGLVLCTLLGGGFSSRLFQKIREEAGLAYSVYSDLGLYTDAGCLSVAVGTSLAALPMVLRYTLREFSNLKAGPAPEAEVRRAKDHLKGSLMLGLESTGSRMANLAGQVAVHGRIRTLDEIKHDIEAVTAQEIEALANAWFQPDRIALTVLGNLNGLRLERADLAC